MSSPFVCHFFTAALLAASFSNLFSQAGVSASTSPSRLQLRDLQSSTRSIAFLHKKLQERHIEGFSFSLMETSSPQFLQSLTYYEQGVQSLLDSKKEEFLNHLSDALRSLDASPERDKPLLRTLLLAREVYTSQATQSDFTNRLVSLAKNLDGHSRGNSDIELANQYEIEYWIQTIATLLNSLEQLKSAPRTFQSQEEIISRTSFSVCSESLLLSQLRIRNQPSVHQHEVLLDELVFGDVRTSFFNELTQLLAEQIQEMPATTQPAAFSLFSLWSGCSTAEFQTLASISSSTMPPEAITDYFAFLTIILRQAESTGQEHLWKTIANSIPSQALTSGPVSSASLEIASALMETPSSTSFSFVERIASTNSDLAPKADVLYLKGLVRANQCDEAVQFASKSLAKHKTLPSEYHFWLGQAQMQTADMPGAFESFSKFLNENSSSRKAPQAGLLAGMTQLNQQKRDTARNFFELVVRHYPNSIEANQARSFLAAIP